MDAELLGYTDALLLPHASTYTVLSKMMVLKRHKILCGKQMKNGLTYQCVYWDNNSNAYTKTFWGSYKYSSDWNYTGGFENHWKLIGVKSKYQIGKMEHQFLTINISRNKELYIQGEFDQSI